MPRLDYDHYLAGPMTGLPEFNFPAFIRTKAWMESQGFKVWSPTDYDMRDSGMPWEDQIRVAISHLILCDNLTMLDGWSRSRGAKLELHISREINMGIYSVRENPWDLIFMGMGHDLTRTMSQV